MHKGIETGSPATNPQTVPFPIAFSPGIPHTYGNHTAPMNRFHLVGIALGLTAGVTAFVSGAQHPAKTLPPTPVITEVSAPIESAPITQQSDDSYENELRLREDYQYFVMYDKLSDKVALCHVELNVIKEQWHYSAADGVFTPEVAKEFSDKHLKRTNNCYGTISG